MQQRQNIKPRFKIPDCYSDTLEELIKIEYENIVLTRNGTMNEISNATISAAAKWLNMTSRKTGLLIYGGVGNGKTTLASAICNIVDKIFYSPVSSERKQFQRISAIKITDTALKEQERFGEIKYAELLFIDDLGCEPQTVKTFGNSIAPLSDVLYYRYDQMKFTIATSNLDETGLSDYYEQRIYDRMNEMFDRLHFVNKSFRK